MKLLYKCSGKLVGKRTNYKAHKSFLLTELCFTDDAVITASTREDIIKATMELKQDTTECINYSVAVMVQLILKLHWYTPTTNSVYHELEHSYQVLSLSPKCV